MNLGSLFKVVNKMKCVVPASAAQLPKHLVVTFVQSYMAGTVSVYLDLSPETGLALVVKDIHNFGSSPGS